MNDDIFRNPLLVANSSRYLVHYRKLLIEKALNNYSQVVTLAPLDESSKELAKYSFYICVLSNHFFLIGKRK